MKRNWDTIRELLTKVEECTTPADEVRLSHFPSERKAEISYHMALLIEANLVHGRISKTMGQEPHDFFAQRLTWNGHEFLDAIRNDTVWTKTKKAFRDKGMDMSFDLVMTIARDAASALMKPLLDN